MFEVRITAETVADLRANVHALAEQYGVAAPAKTEAAPPAKTEAAPPAKRKTRSKPGLQYDKDVKPLLIKLASHSDEGKAQAKEMITSRGFKKGDEIPEEEFPSIIKELNDAIAGLDSAEDEEAF